MTSQRPWAIRLPPMAADELKRRLGRWTLANQLTFLRLVAIPLFVLAVLDGRFLLAFCLFVGAGVTDALDGLIARAFAQRTALGAYLDPAADKLLLAAGFILLTDYPSLFKSIAMVNRIPIWLTVLTISRDVFIVAISLMLYLAYGHRRFKPTLLGKFTTGCEIVTIAAVLLWNHFGTRHAFVGFSIAVTLAFTLASGLQYLWRTVLRVRAEGTEGNP